MFNIDNFINTISTFSKDNDGVTRLAFTNESKQARDYLIKTMKELDMEVKYDKFGAVLGTYNSEAKEAIILCSHYDSVIHGGKYDGIVGIVTALATVSYFKENCIKPKYKIYVLCTNDEEGVTFAQGFLVTENVCDELIIDNYNNAATGKKLQDYLDEHIYDDKQDHEIKLKTTMKDATKYLEVHIEQASVLDSLNIPIGIVKNIFGITRYYVDIYGIADHAGGTPMNMRKDALVCASRIIAKVCDIASSYEDSVATVGQIIVEPNASNVIPGHVRFSLDIRSAHRKSQVKVCEDIINLINNEAKDLKYSIEQSFDKVPTPMNLKIIQELEQTIKTLDIPYIKMNSGASHDAQIFAKFIDTAMLFVPSIKGISHSPKEYTRIEDIQKAIETLITYLQN